jgi:hypothetical protein
MAKRQHNLRTSIVPNHCVVCNEPKGTFITAKTARFKSNFFYSDGAPCDNCKPAWEKMIKQLINGGTLVKCKECGAVTVWDTIPETLQQHVTQLPGGAKRLEIAGCPTCTKENTDAHASETQDPELGT